MKVRDICSRPVVTATPLDRLADVAGRMLDEGVSAIAVVEDGGLVGILTEHDVMRAMVEGPGSRVAEVSRFMTRSVVTADPDESTSAAARRMVAARVRHLPVQEGSRLIGMVSARDLLEVEGRRAASEPGNEHVHLGTTGGPR